MCQQQQQHKSSDTTAEVYLTQFSLLVLSQWKMSKRTASGLKNIWKMDKQQSQNWSIHSKNMEKNHQTNTSCSKTATFSYVTYYSLRKFPSVACSLCSYILSCSIPASVDWKLNIVLKRKLHFPVVFEDNAGDICLIETGTWWLKRESPSVLSDCFMSSQWKMCRAF